MARHTCFNLLCTLAAFEWGIGAGPMPGQTMSFVRRFSTPGMERAVAVASDASGIYVIGNKPPAHPGGPYQAGIRKYDAQGNELWTRQFSVPMPGGAQLIGAAADGSGVYVIGYWRSVQNGDAFGQFMRKYSAAGDELWTNQLDVSPLDGVAADTSGVYVIGRGTIRKYNGGGNELWTSRVGDGSYASATAVAVDPTGVYVLGMGTRSTAAEAANFFSVGKWDREGNEVWTRDIGPFADRDSNPELIVAAEPAGFFVAGGNGGNTFLRKYDAAGNELWSRPAATSYSSLYLAGVAADATGVYVAGFTPLTSLAGQCRSASGGDSFIRKFDPDGGDLWTREFGTSDASWASGVAVDAGGVYVVGADGSNQLAAALYLNIFPTADSGSGVFLAKFEKSPAAIGGSGPRIFPDCILNAASYVGGGVAPGEIVTILGSAIGPIDLVPGRAPDENSLPTSLANTRILFNGVPAALLYVSQTQSSAIVPYAMTSGASVDVVVEYNGVRSDAVTVPVLASRPGIFSLDGSGQGQGAILNEDGSTNSPSNPARKGSVLTIYATGGGENAPGVGDGALPVSAFFDISPSGEEGELAPKQGEVLYAGGAAGSVAGMLQVKVRVPANAAVTGDAVPFALIIGDRWEAFQVTFALR